MAAFIVIYHRLPFEESIVKGKRTLREPRSPNGIIPSLKGFFRYFENGLWLAWQKVPDEQLGQLGPRDTLQAGGHGYDVQSVGLTAELVESFYHRTSKSALWPILHSFTERFDYDAADWDKFRLVNELFARAACEVADPGATLWIHDYNLWLVPGMIRAKRPDVKIAFFHHTPFPSSDMFGILPWRREILESLLCCDRIGFHAARYAENFAASACSFIRAATPLSRAIAPPRLQQEGIILQESFYTSSIRHGDHVVELDVAPIGVDDQAIRRVASQASTDARARELRAHLGAERIILSIGRIDYTKGTREMLLAYEQLLEQREDLRGKVRLCVTSVAPAAGIRAYDDVREDVERRVGSINGRYSTSDWSPILFFTSPIHFSELIAWYRAADICWITPLRDGLNLVVKEYVAARSGLPGVVVLSEFTGAAIELDEAILTHPYSARNMVAAIARAIDLPEADARAQIQALDRRVRKHNLSAWTQEMLELLKAEPLGT